MSEDFSRRKFLEVALATAAVAPLANAQQMRPDDHDHPNEENSGVDSAALALLRKSEAIMGSANVKTIQYSASGMIAAVGQSYGENEDWPRFEVPNYTRVVDFDARSSREEYTRRQGIYPPHGGGDTPLKGEKTTVNFINGKYTWALEDGTLVPQPGGYLYGTPMLDYRQLDMIVTPIGFLKAAQAPGANPTMISLTLPPHGGIAGGKVNLVKFTALGKYRVVGMFNEHNLIELVDTWIANPVYGDMNLEYRYLGYKDFGGVKYPTLLHNHQGDFRLNRAHNWMYLTISDFKADAGGPAVIVPESVRTAVPPAPKAVSQKLADGVWLISGSEHNSVAIEFKDFVTVIEAPENEERSLAVIDEVSRLVPNKIIQYVVNTHAHWDHAGGLRTYMAHGTIVVTHKLNEYYFDRIVFNPAPSRIEPDQFSTYYPYFSNDRRVVGLAMELVDTTKKYVISDDTRTIDVYPVGVAASFSAEEISPMNEEGRSQHLPYHVNGMLVIYLPKEKILVNADMYSPPSAGTPNPVADIQFSKTLQQLIQRNKLDVDLHVPIEGQPGSNAEFERILGRSNKAEPERPGLQKS